MHIVFLFLHSVYSGEQINCHSTVPCIT